MEGQQPCRGGLLVAMKGEEAGTNRRCSVTHFLLSGSLPVTPYYMEQCSGCQDGEFEWQEKETVSRRAIAGGFFWYERPLKVAFCDSRAFAFVNR